MEAVPCSRWVRGKSLEQTNAGPASLRRKVTSFRELSPSKLYRPPSRLYKWKLSRTFLGSSLDRSLHFGILIFSAAIVKESPKKLSKCSVGAVGVSAEPGKSDTHRCLAVSSKSACGSVLKL